ncbi:MAG TPA: hypothetical protein VGM19_13815 [Armatimonadota bacterium]|jgi:hypothetical protein
MFATASRLMVLVGLLGLSLAGLASCGRSEVDTLAPTTLNLWPGSASANEGEFVALAAGKYIVRYRGQWEPQSNPERRLGYVAPPGGFAAYSPDQQRVALTMLREHGREVYVYLYDHLRYQIWAGVATYGSYIPMPLAARFDGDKLQVVSALARRGGDTVERLGYDLTVLSDTVRSDWFPSAARVAEVTTPAPLPLPSDYVAAAFLGGQPLCVALAGTGQVWRWRPGQPRDFDSCLPVSAVAAQAGSEATARQTRFRLITTVQEGPVFAAGALPAAAGQPGATLVWRIPASGPPQFVGAVRPPAGATDQLLELVARADGQGWAEVWGSPVSSDDPVPPTPDGRLFLAGPHFEAPQAVEVAGRAVQNPSWAPRGDRLYFVVGGTEVWSWDKRQGAQLVAEAPPLAGLLEKTAPHL